MQLEDKTDGVDSINVKILKNISPYLIIALEYICNTCIETPTWLDARTTAEIVPIHKSGYKLLTTN